ncbi:hypothetical protein [Marinomonas rhodophyticola]|uniref:Uncharacterized protein n=1 Tax=Marinomonas rhodophyticola TaxID=2992803 RepID=A0ABT3KGI9_9GAMM|nr:hypothetical protein [Marinomonas sp. KJ51-3]MCW4629663.1 hypothetical protein [Marinomonas sp. KJ51-3]
MAGQRTRITRMAIINGEPLIKETRRVHPARSQKDHARHPWRFLHPLVKSWWG